MNMRTPFSDFSNRIQKTEATSCDNSVAVGARLWQRPRVSFQAVPCRVPAPGRLGSAHPAGLQPTPRAVCTSHPEPVCGATSSRRDPPRISSARKQDALPYFVASPPIPSELATGPAIKTSQFPALCPFFAFSSGFPSTSPSGLNSFFRQLGLYSTLPLPASHLLPRSLPSSSLTSLGVLTVCYSSSFCRAVAFIFQGSRVLFNRLLLPSALRPFQVRIKWAQNILQLDGELCTATRAPSLPSFPPRTLPSRRCHEITHSSGHEWGVFARKRPAR